MATRTSQQEKEMLKRASSMGDAQADLALKDIQEEEGDYQGEDFVVPKKGDWVMIFTLGFHFAGQITGIDHEWIGLARGHAWINNTGPLSSIEQGTFSDWELESLPGVVAKGAIYKIKIYDKPLILKN